jgi:DNA-binding beta-propeller fold protein YncE
MLILDQHGNILKRVGRRNRDEALVDFRSPTEIAIGHEEVVVLDATGSRIQVFDLDGLVRQFSTGLSARQASSLQNGMGLGVDSDGNIYLSNLRNPEVLIFSSDGTLLNSFGKIGAHDAQFRSPTGLWIQDSRLLVADAVNRRISVFEIRTQTQPKRSTLMAGAP